MNCILTIFTKLEKYKTQSIPVLNQIQIHFKIRVALTEGNKMKVVCNNRFVISRLTLKIQLNKARVSKNVKIKF